jgi:hydrogenase maturation protease
MEWPFRRVPESLTAPTLVLAYGNPGRGDDGLGPAFAGRLRERLRTETGIELWEDFQLQVEHALELRGRTRVVFVDASVDASTPFALQAVQAVRDASFTTHALSPQAVLSAFCLLQGEAPPPAWLLAIRGYGFELGAPLTPAAEENLDCALAWFEEWAGRGYCPP